MPDEIPYSHYPPGCDGPPEPVYECAYCLISSKREHFIDHECPTCKDPASIPAQPHCNNCRRACAYFHHSNSDDFTNDNY